MSNVESKPSRYVVLRKVEVPAPEPVGPAEAADRVEIDRWEVAGIVEANGTDQAIRKVAADYLENASTSEAAFVFVATPARSWQPVTVKAERTMKINLGAV